MTLEDIKAIEELKKAAPHSYKCSSLWYEIAAKYGISEQARDDVRDKFMEAPEVFELKQNIRILIDCISAYRFWFDTCTKTNAENWEEKAAKASEMLDWAIKRCQEI